MPGRRTLTQIVCVHTIPASIHPEGPVTKIDAFAHILPPAYAERLESITSGPDVSERILGYRPWIREDPALTDLDSRRRTTNHPGRSRPGLSASGTCHT